MPPIKQFCVNALAILNRTPAAQWAEQFVRLKFDFWNQFAGGRIFSTAHGTDFFQNVINACDGKTWLEEVERETGKLDNEYGKNFRAMIKDYASRTS